MRRDFLLLALVLLILLLGHIVVLASYPLACGHLTHGHTGKILATPIGMTLAWAVLLGVLVKRNCRATLLLPVAALLTGLGVLFLLRLAAGAETLSLDVARDFSSHYAKQVTFFYIGMALLLGMMLWRWSLAGLARYKYLVGFGAVLLLLVTTLFGQAENGQQIALNLKLFTFQPHDLVKLLIVIFMAAYLAEKRELLDLAAKRSRFLSVLDLRYLGPMIALWLLVMAIVFKHKDLGAALLLFGIFLGMLYLGTGRMTYIGIGLGMFAAGVWAAYKIVPLVKVRLALWLNPWQEITVGNHRYDGYQLTQALMALGNGRLIGAGLGGGFPENIPAVHTDMIYAAISEDLGLVGAFIVLMLYVTLIQRLFAVSLRATDRFAQLLVAGLGVSLAVQTLVIIGGVVKAIPLTGVTLPFISAGGTSLVLSFLMLGLVFKAALPAPAAESAQDQN